MYMHSDKYLEEPREHKISTYHLFVDFEAAYDSVNRDQLLNAMQECKIPKN